MKCQTCGNDAGKNHQGIAKTYCNNKCRDRGSRPRIAKRQKSFADIDRKYGEKFSWE